MAEAVEKDPILAEREEYVARYGVAPSEADHAIALDVVLPLGDHGGPAGLGEALLKAMGR